MQSCHQALNTVPLVRLSTDASRPCAIGILSSYTGCTSGVEMTTLKWQTLDFISRHHNQAFLSCANIPKNLDLEDRRPIWKDLQILNDDRVHAGRCPFVDGLQNVAVVSSDKEDVIVAVIHGTELPVHSDGGHPMAGKTETLMFVHVNAA